MTFDWNTESFSSSTYLRQTLLQILISSIEKVRGVALEAKQPDNIFESIDSLSKNTEVYFASRRTDSKYLDL